MQTVCSQLGRTGTLRLLDLNISRDNPAPMKVRVAPKSITCVQTVSVGGKGAEYEIENCEIELLKVHNGCRRLTIRNCTIGKLDHATTSTTALLELDHCRVGNLRLQGHCLIDFHVTRRSRLFELEFPSGQNPFIRNVIISGSRFSRNGAFLSDAQEYRNARSFLLALGNTPAAGIFLSPELIADRHSEPPTNRTISHIYQALSDFGNSISRPLLWWVGSGLLFAYLYWLQGSPSPAHVDIYALTRTDTVGEVARSGILALASMVDPLGFANLSGLVKETSLAMICTHVAHRLISIILVALTLLAIRRRFKIS